MKKQLISVIAILVLFSLSTSAQDNSKTRSNIKIGVLGGISLADIKSNSTQDEKTNIAPVLALLLNFLLFRDYLLN